MPNLDWNLIIKAIIFYVSVLLGVLARTYMPFLQAKKEDPSLRFDMKFLSLAKWSLIINLIAAPIAAAHTSFEAGPLVGLSTGWAVQDITRTVQAFAEPAPPTPVLATLLIREPGGASVFQLIDFDSIYESAWGK